MLVLKKRLLHELKASAGKTAALALLLLVGLYFWLPPLWRALGFGATAPAPAPAAVGLPATPAPTAATQAAPRRAIANTWDQSARTLESDPLVKTADAATIGGDPFRVDAGQFPPPILFAEEPARVAPSQPAAPAVAEKLPDDMELKSTIIGRTRRAAFINDKLYAEGADVRIGGETYRLEAVHPRRVLLKRGGLAFELKIPGPPAFDVETDPSQAEPAGEPRGL
ncbi:MAG: hypothetical protein WD069_11255 [Planctomycetales bacterium]